MHGVHIWKDEFDMRIARYALIPWLVLWAHGFSQTDDYAPEKENAIQKIKPGKQLYKEDEPCGAYFWKSEKADRSGATALYYFYGSAEYGKGKMGLYQKVRYRVVVNDEKDTPTAQIVKDDHGIVKEVVVRMTRREFDASKACFPQK
ncbi:MAG: hypothetical protein LAQ69_06225 [Acidobacteriia bacterium]|nr:hypothetical protein [Terriglobia bacterium]